MVSERETFTQNSLEWILLSSPSLLTYTHDFQPDRIDCNQPTILFVSIGNNYLFAPEKPSGYLHSGLEAKVADKP